mmetsp:Transcript_22745/g.52054  ORF Transcript_22745/g.52054 Transcript_22745/m.52054 type:complete len:252 (+) Transcript_22745:90-845(+)
MLGGPTTAMTSLFFMPSMPTVSSGWIRWPLRQNLVLSLSKPMRSHATVMKVRRGILRRRLKSNILSPLCVLTLTWIVGCSCWGGSLPSALAILCSRTDFATFMAFLKYASAASGPLASFVFWNLRDIPPASFQSFARIWSSVAAFNCAVFATNSCFLAILTFSYLSLIAFFFANSSSCFCFAKASALRFASSSSAALIRASSWRRFFSIASSSALMRASSAFRAFSSAAFLWRSCCFAFSAARSLSFLACS